MVHVNTDHVTHSSGKRILVLRVIKSSEQLNKHLQDYILKLSLKYSFVQDHMAFSFNSAHFLFPFQNVIYTIFI